MLLNVTGFARFPSNSIKIPYLSAIPAAIAGVSFSEPSTLQKLCHCLLAVYFRDHQLGIFRLAARDIAVTLLVTDSFSYEWSRNLTGRIDRKQRPDSKDLRCQ